MKRMKKMVVLMLIMMLCSNGALSRSVLSTKVTESACKSTSVPDFCKKALEADQAALKASSVAELAKATVELMIKNTTASQKLLQKEEGGGSPPPLKEALKKCVGSYTSVVKSFKSALSELDQDPLSANYDIFSSKDYVDDCKAALSAASQPLPSAVSDSLQTLYNFIQVGFGITNLLE